MYGSSVFYFLTTKPRITPPIGIDGNKRHEKQDVSQILPADAVRPVWEEQNGLKDRLDYETL